LRSIPFDKLRLPEGWATKAQKALDDVAKIAAGLPGSSEEESDKILKQLRAEINKRSEIWASLKDALGELSFRKCWYCESMENRSDMAVDHFRPKNKVMECTAHLGYWWLAFDHSNYRFACGYCNSPHENDDQEKTLGKGTHFPLIEEARRIHGSGGDLTDEQPTLLDPTVPMDPSLLWFTDDGRAVPRYRLDNSPLFYSRASVSVDVYNLNDFRIKEARVVVAIEIKRQVELGDRYLDEAMGGSPAALDLYKEICRRILTFIAPQAEFSSAARAILSGYRDKEWVADTLRTA
jgi:uncharacterized protein (TIGR02646 family)